jgi:hypothetical protein
MSAPYACWRFAIWPGLDWVVNGGSGSAFGGCGASRGDRRRRTIAPAPPAAAAAAKNARIFIVSRR